MGCKRFARRWPTRYAGLRLAWPGDQGARWQVEAPRRQETEQAGGSRHQRIAEQRAIEIHGQAQALDQQHPQSEAGGQQQCPRGSAHAPPQDGPRAMENRTGWEPGGTDIGNSTDPWMGLGFSRAA